jgi:hypothetical protein
VPRCGLWLVRSTRQVQVLSFLGCLCRPHTDAISTSVIGKKPAKAALGAWKLDACTLDTKRSARLSTYGATRRSASFGMRTAEAHQGHSFPPPPSSGLLCAFIES